MESVTQSLAGLSITPSATVSHAETSSPANWREAITAAPSAPKSFELIKTLVFKPKTAKTAVTIPVVVIARDETETNSGALGKKLNLKELRLASEDLLKEFFLLDKNSCMCFFSELISILHADRSRSTVSPLALNKESFPKVLTVIDSSIATSSSVFAVHALSSSETVFLSGKDIVSYLTSIESGDAKIQEVDFETLKTDAPAPAAASSKQPKEKESAKIEGAVQVAVGVKKEVDFAAWYTNVRLSLPCSSRSTLTRL